MIWNVKVIATVIMVKWKGISVDESIIDISASEVGDADSDLEISVDIQA